MKSKILILILISTLVATCGQQVEKQPTDILPVGWQVVEDRQTYLPYFEQYVNNHPRISMPLQRVYGQTEGEVKVYRGIVVGEKADKTREAIIAHHGYENCERSSADATAGQPPLLVCRSADSGVTITCLFHDASPTETYVYAILDSARNDGHDPNHILQSFISETPISLEAQ
ncbi:hypothetical protein CEQ90_08135 [Lewinellaceae bacterium SD302]|nr:hypothetical protein CEQ90_08135 [Lewinellaceae bacterium SD302]